MFYQWINQAKKSGNANNCICESDQNIWQKLHWPIEYVQTHILGNIVFTTDLVIFKIKDKMIAAMTNV